jgi:hypothetical protein
MSLVGSSTAQDWHGPIGSLAVPAEQNATSKGPSPYPLGGLGSVPYRHSYVAPEGVTITQLAEAKPRTESCIPRCQKFVAFRREIVQPYCYNARTWGMLMIENLYFGKDDAESDIGRGGLLAKSFLETSQYKDALNGKKWLILGRKGSGKSAICLKLAGDMPDRACLVTPDEISAEEIKRFELGGILSYQSKELLWRYIFCVQIAKYLLRQAKKKKTHQPSALEQTIRQFLLDCGEAEDVSGIERFWKIIEKIKLSLKINPTKEVEFKGEIQLSSGVRASERINDTEEKLVHLARLVLGKTKASQPKFYLLIDQVERIWSNDPGSDSLVIGLLRAAKYAQAKYEFATVLAFLRIDIYEKLTFPERDKLRSDELHIRWGSDDLISLIEKRAVASTGEKNAAKMLWGSIFPRRVGEQDVKKFLANRTLNRPRDIIQLANACRDIAKAKGRDAITSWDITTAAAQYSRWKLVDIQNEWTVNYPFLTDGLLLMSNSSYMFTRAQFDAKYKLVANDFRTRYPAAAALLSSDYLLSVSFLIGVLGVIREKTTRYSCDAPSDESVRASDNDFIIHPCFREGLQCVSAINLKPFEQNPIDVEILHSRFERGLSVHIESMAKASYSLREVESLIHRVKQEVAGSKLSSEIKEEILLSVVAIEGQVRRCGFHDDYESVSEVLTKAGLYFSDLGNRVLETEILNRKDDLVYTVSNVSDACLEYTAGRFRRGMRGNA